MGMTQQDWINSGADNITPQGARRAWSDRFAEAEKSGTPIDWTDPLGRAWHIASEGGYYTDSAGNQIPISADSNIKSLGQDMQDSLKATAAATGLDWYTPSTAPASSPAPAPAPLPTTNMLDFSGNNMPIPFSASGLDANGMAKANSLMEQYLSMLPGYKKAQDRLLTLPEEIDRWTQDQARRYRVTGDDTARAMEAVATQRANSGIMGGTETQNLLANTMAALERQERDKQDELYSNANQLKSAAILGAPQTSSFPLQALNSLIDSTKSSYSEDPSVIYSTIADLIRAGYTG